MAAAAAAASAFLLFIAGILLPTSSSAAAAAGPYDPPTVRDLMDRYGLPRALLPDTARRYLLHDDGSFQLFLDDGCVAEAGGYRVGYDIKLSGAVAPGRVTGLKGVRVRVLFAWVPVTGVEVAGGEVTISLGPLRKSFAAVGFKSSPRCISGAAGGDRFLIGLDF
uniref:Xylanase inhibitor C-terminal domain-containing protein n=1 Tax=Leersia perrieri TaxID=77586 RepID=A0A0D9W5D7_9ORYZ